MLGDLILFDFHHQISSCFSVKLNQLRSVAHNIADSLSSGMGFLIGAYSTDIYQEASLSADGRITVDFLRGIATGTVSDSLAKAVALYRDALVGLCNKQGLSIELFQELSATYFTNDKGEECVIIHVQDNKGRSKHDTYVGSPLQRVKNLDTRGRTSKLGTGSPT